MEAEVMEIRHAEDALGYPYDERTRFSVRFEVYGKPCVLRTITSLHDCQRHYIAARDESGLGASQFSTGEIHDQYGQHVATISYNGRLWRPLPWRPNSTPIAEAPEPKTAPSSGHVITVIFTHRGDWPEPLIYTVRVSDPKIEDAVLNAVTAQRMIDIDAEYEDFDAIRASIHLHFAFEGDVKTAVDWRD